MTNNHSLKVFGDDKNDGIFIQGFRCSMTTTNSDKKNNNKKNHQPRPFSNKSIE